MKLRKSGRSFLLYPSKSHLKVQILSIASVSAAVINMLAFQGTLVLTLVVLGLFKAAFSDDYQNRTRLDTKNETSPTFELYWTYNKTKSTISFAAKAKTTGWVGLGFTPRIDNTTTYDLVKGYFDSFAGKEKTEIYDYHAVGEETPVKDSQQNLMNASVAIDGQYVVLKFKRLLDTKDPNDIIIKPGPTIVIWSYSNQFRLNSSHREMGYKTVNLIPEREHDTSPTKSPGQTTSEPKDPESSAEVCQVKWVLLTLTAVLMTSGLSQS